MTDANDLAERCQEILDWHATGLLVDGRLRRLAATMTFAPEHIRLDLAEKQTADEAMQRVVSERNG